MTLELLGCQRKGRYLMSAGAPVPTYLPPSPIHKLITIATPQNGSPFAQFLEDHQNDVLFGAPVLADENQVFSILGAVTNNCTLGGFLNLIDNKIDTGVLSLESGLKLYSQTYRSIIGQASFPSGSETLLDAALLAFATGGTDDGILGVPNDTIVPTPNQAIGQSIQQPYQELFIPIYCRFPGFLL